MSTTKQLKPSRFNHYVCNSQGELILFNTLTGRSCKTEQQESGTVKKLLEQPTVPIGDDRAGTLQEGGFLLDASGDEDALLNSLYLDIVGEDTLSLVILTTEQCNFRCTYCYEKFEAPAMPLEIQNQLIQFVKKNINRYSGLSVSWFGGEPLMAMDVVRNLSKAFLELCKINHKPYTAGMTTNGSLLTLERFRELMRYRVLHYQVTLDGPRATHDKQRLLANGEGSFDKILDNLTQIKQNVTSMGFRFMLRTNVSMPVYEVMDDYIHVINDRFGGDKRFRLLIRFAGDFGGERVKDFRGNMVKNWQDVSKDIYKRLLESDTNIEFGSPAALMGPGSGVCYVNKKNNLSISPRGVMHKCTQYLESESLTRFGELRDYPTGYDWPEAAKWVMKNELEYEQCKTCFYLPACFGTSCPMLKYHHTYLNAPKSPDPHCPYEKYVVDELLLLSDKAGNIPYLERG